MPTVEFAPSVATSNSWTSPSNGKVTDGVYSATPRTGDSATSSVADLLVLDSFGFAIPSTATITSATLQTCVAKNDGAARPYEIKFYAGATLKGSVSGTLAEAFGGDLGPISLPGTWTFAELNQVKITIWAEPPIIIINPTEEVIEAATPAEVDGVTVRVVYTLPPPNAPSLAGAVAPTVCSLVWTNVLDAASYTLKRATSAGGPYTNVYAGTDLVFNDTGRTNGVTYYYVVTATNVYGESGNSNEVALTPTASPPVVISAPVISASVDFETITVSWSAVPLATSYSVFSKPSCTGSTTLLAVTSDTSYSETGSIAVERCYVVTATNGSVTSAESNCACARVTTGEMFFRWAKPLSEADAANGGICAHSGFWAPAHKLVYDNKGRRVIDVFREK